MNEGQDEINDVPLAMSPNGNNFQSTTQFSLGLQIVLAILFTCAIQGTQTIGLHCIELLENMSRDEETWKEAMITPKKRKQGSKATGARLKTNPFKTAATSWQNITLFASKALLHWLLGQSLLTTISIYADFKNYQFDMIYMRIFVYGIVATALAIFTTYQAAYQRKGSLPAAWGHFQTLADLVDDWGKGEESDLWWGDKSAGDLETRHAGTASSMSELGDIQIVDDYAAI